MSGERRYRLRRAEQLLSLVLTAAIVACRPSAERSRDSFDVVIQGGRVVDGAGNPAYLGDVAIRGDRIVAVAPAGRLDSARAGERIDARGLVVAPGFIDIQSHSRSAFLVGDGRVVSKITQGITTEIMGEGWTNAPANERTMAVQRGEDETADPKLSAKFTGPHGFDAWLTAMEQHGVSPNIGSFVGHGTVRVYAKGEAMGEATAAEVDTMRSVVRRAMEDGAFGLASALIYPPATFASTKELVAVAQAMADLGGLYISHIRSEGPGLLEGLDEAIEIGTEAGVPVEIYHLKAAGQEDWYKLPLAIAKIDSARRAGLSIEADMYPYVAAGTGLTSRLPPWASADGKLYENLADAPTRAKIKSEMPQYAGTTPASMLVLGLEKPEHHRWVGLRLSEIAAQQGKDWRDAAIDLLLGERQRIATVFFLMSEENTELAMRQPWIKFATDAGGVDPDSTTALLHPRSYGTYPRVLGHYVRDRGVLSLEDAIRKMTSAVANRLWLEDRGLLRPGMAADVVVFDPATILDRSTYDKPNQLSLGVRHVFVNGVRVLRDGRHTGAKPGRALRGPGYRAQAH